MSNSLQLVKKSDPINEINIRTVVFMKVYGIFQVCFKKLLNPKTSS